MWSFLSANIVLLVALTVLENYYCFITREELYTVCVDRRKNSCQKKTPYVWKSQFYLLLRISRPAFSAQGSCDHGVYEIFWYSWSWKFRVLKVKLGLWNHKNEKLKGYFMISLWDHDTKWLHKLSDRTTSCLMDELHQASRIVSSLV